MVRLTRIYTRRGDKGTTALVGGRRIPKTAPRLEAYGTIDELNSFLGVLRTHASISSVAVIREGSEQVLRKIQNDLFDIGNLLATSPDEKQNVESGFGAARVAELESHMDSYQTILEPLPSFVLPGGGVLNADAHVARSVCRRAERLLWRLNAEEPVLETVLQYLNRLSDFLFVYSRWAARLGGEKEFLWDTPISRGQGRKMARDKNKK